MLEESSLNVFVYGTLKPGECNHEPYCGAKAIAITKAYAKGVLFDLPTLGYPAMIEGEGKVQGFLLKFPDWSVLTLLDSLEGYDPMRSPSQNEYQRQKITVYTPSGEAIEEVWAYLMAHEKVKQLGGIWLPSGVWSKEA
ncbi:MAG: gamma-glutamylcyclotransferase family protein [Cyanobacteriota bacterium]